MLGANTGTSFKLEITDVVKPTECDTTCNTAGLNDAILPDYRYNCISTVKDLLLNDVERNSGDFDRNFDCELEIIDDDVSIGLDLFCEKLNSSNTFSPSRCESDGRRKDYCRKDYSKNSKCETDKKSENYLNSNWTDAIVLYESSTLFFLYKTRKIQFLLLQMHKRVSVYRTLL